jgi:glycosyltransferase involved in cell wall biosynthesis
MEKRVLHLVSNLNFGGVQSVLYNTLNSHFRYDFILMIPNGTLEKKFFEHGSKIYNSPSYIKNPFKFYKFLKKIKHENNYSIIHFHLNFASIIPLWISFILRFKGRIVHSHNDYPEKSLIKNFIKSLIKLNINLFATHMIGCSLTASNWLFGKSPLFSRKMYVIYNGIDYSKFYFNPNIRNEIRKEFNYDDKFIIGNVANFSAQKNHFFFIDLVKKLKSIIPSLLVIFIGEGGTKDNIANLIKKENLENNFLLLGKKENISAFLSSFDLFLLPSLFEGFPVSLIEAQVNGLPVLVSDDVTKEVSLCNQCDFLSLKDQDSWIKKIVFYYENNNERLQNQEFNPKFNIDLQINKFIEIYNMIIKGNS